MLVEQEALENEEGIGDEEPLTPEEQRMFEIGLALDEAFRRDPSITAMNRVYRQFRTGDAKTDRAIRDHIGLLYLFERARPALSRAAKKGDLATATNRGRPPQPAVDAMDRLKASVSESEQDLVEA